jgi:hypothetical protein
MVFIVTRSYSQVSDPQFTDFKKSRFHKMFYPVFRTSGPTFIEKNLSFKPGNPVGRKPVFCQMEDHISSRYNFVLQLRAGSDEHYRSLAFPERVEKRKRYVE